MWGSPPPPPCSSVSFLFTRVAAALLAEYTTIGALFGVYLDSKRYPIIIVVGVLTTIYTVYGGLVVSIYTDQIQGACCACCACCTVCCAGPAAWLFGNDM